MTCPNVLDLFAGACGGWSLGLHRAGFQTVAACEIDPWRRAVFSHNFPDARMYDNVRGLSAERIISDIGRLPDIIVGSPPCQDASVANPKGRGVDGERTGLFFEALRLVGECRPRWCVFENVPGIRTRGVDRLLGALEALGYACQSFVVGADDVGANHARKRVWIIAFDPAQVGCDGGRAWRRGAHGDGATYPARGIEAPAADAYEGAGRPMGSTAWDRREPESDIGDAIETGLGSGKASLETDEPERQAAERTIGVCADDAHTDSDRQSNGAVDAEMGGRSRAYEDVGGPWAHWNGGLAYHLRLDDGLSAQLADERGVAAAIIAAFGDSVCPQIPEAIGKAIWRVECALAIARGRDAA